MLYLIFDTDVSVVLFTPTMYWEWISWNLKHERFALGCHKLCVTWNASFYFHFWSTCVDHLYETDNDYYTGISSLVFPVNNFTRANSFVLFNENDELTVESNTLKYIIHKQCPLSIFIGFQPESSTVCFAYKSQFECMCSRKKEIEMLICESSKSFSPAKTRLQ